MKNWNCLLCFLDFRWRKKPLRFVWMVSGREKARKCKFLGGTQSKYILFLYLFTFFFSAFADWSLHQIGYHTSTMSPQIDFEYQQQQQQPQNREKCERSQSYRFYLFKVIRKKVFENIGNNPVSWQNNWIALIFSIFSWFKSIQP